MENKRKVIIKNSVSADGIGIPVISLYFSYCDKKDITGSFCCNCHNKELQNDGYGYELDLKTIFKILKEKIQNMESLINDKVGIAFLGGEPLAEINRDFFIKISEEFKNTYQVLYTWRYLENINEFWVENVDKIVCGEYIENLKNEKYILGSTNQYIINSKKEIILKYERNDA